MEEEIKTQGNALTESARGSSPAESQTLEDSPPVAEPAVAVSEPSAEIRSAPEGKIETSPVEAFSPQPPRTGKQKKPRKGITFKGICIHCGERFTLSEEEMAQRSFGFCNAECRMKFDMDLAEDID